MKRVVIDTNVIISSLMSRDNACRALLRLAFLGDIKPLMGNALYLEYEDVMERDILERSPFNAEKRAMFLDDFFSVSEWVNIDYLWRPNLRDEADNHLVELAVAGNAACIVSSNLKDLKSGDLVFDDIRIVNPVDFLREERSA